MRPFAVSVALSAAVSMASGMAAASTAPETRVGRGGALFCQEPDHLEDAYKALRDGGEEQASLAFARYHCGLLPEGTKVVVIEDVSRSAPGAVKVRAFFAAGSLIVYSVRAGFVAKLPKTEDPPPVALAKPLPEPHGPDVTAPRAPAAAAPAPPPARPSNGPVVPPAAAPAPTVQTKPSARQTAAPKPPSPRVAPTVGKRDPAASAVPAKQEASVRIDQPGAVFRDCASCQEMIVLAAGAFSMGSGATPYDRPIHRVTIAKPFAMARSEVTFAEWGHCIADRACSFRPDGPGDGAHPVTNVSWADAKLFVGWLAKRTGKTYRLPSEAEWEYAAHGGTRTATAEGSPVGAQRANCAGCGGVPLAPQSVAVRSFPPNGFGLYDMVGNAAEWVEDCWNPSYGNAPADGSAWLTGTCEQRVLRGGSFDSSAAFAKPSARFRYDADVRYWANGFRVVREIP